MKINKGIYSKVLNKKNIHLFWINYMSGDQTERRSNTYLFGSGGNFGSRFGYQANMKQIHEFLPS